MLLLVVERKRIKKDSTHENRTVDRKRIGCLWMRGRRNERVKGGERKLRNILSGDEEVRGVDAFVTCHIL